MSNYGQKNAIRFESILNQSTAKVYTDGSKLNGRVGSAFYAEYPNNSPKQAFIFLSPPKRGHGKRICDVVVSHFFSMF